MEELKYSRVAIKVGSNVLTKQDGRLNIAMMAHIVDQISFLHKKGVQVVLISSGAVAAGRNVAVSQTKLDDISARQLWASLGQVKLINRYADLFSEHGLQCGQVLTTKENFSDRQHYLNMKNCLTTLLDNRIIPIVNENDSISVEELMFTDNDELTGLIASLTNSQAVFLLSNVNGIYTGNPADVGAELISKVGIDSPEMEQYIQSAKSGFGRGGMLTKYKVARKMAMQGIEVYIASGLRENIVLDIFSEKNDTPFTQFIADRSKASTIRTWLSHSHDFTRGKVVINKGAEEALLADQANSLLPVGVVSIEGKFETGDIIGIVNQDNIIVGVGKTAYDSDYLKHILGEHDQKAVIHYNYLHLSE